MQGFPKHTKSCSNFSKEYNTTDPVLISETKMGLYWKQWQKWLGTSSQSEVYSSKWHIVCPDSVQGTPEMLGNPYIIGSALPQKLGGYSTCIPRSNPRILS